MSNQPKCETCRWWASLPKNPVDKSEGGLAFASAALLL
jgi:hypothetical protein